MNHADGDKNRPRLDDPVSYYRTRASIFERLNSPDPSNRETAWQEFFSRYRPVIAGFAKRCGANQQDIDDIVQDVTTSFLSVSREFTYNPAKGRFRGWLKTCTVRATIRRSAKAMKFQGVSLEGREDIEPVFDPIWEDVWEQKLVGIALNHLRQNSGDGLTFRAFERYVLLDRPAQDVAKELGTTVENVYQAKTRMTKRLRDLVGQLREADD
ncbi:MAG TPA: sigma-70 family RNA polymerase sigma factor [Tepidisphaeraceae bacterium]|jgi:RNA polymerase sigma-70 factor (ECF subfamily)|nr:sigma-70 family RNA polymerase sigma factor [Tepidisphaeraceae bacterium]